MNALLMARELGKAIQKEDFYQQLQTAKANNDLDAELQNLIGEFNVKRMAMGEENAKPEKNSEAIAKLDSEIKNLYRDIMENEHMKAFNIAKKEMDSMMQQINTILMLSVNGEDPDEIDLTDPGCSGSCSSCSGCH